MLLVTLFPVWIAADAFKGAPKVDSPSFLSSDDQYYHVRAEIERAEPSIKHADVGGIGNSERIIESTKGEKLRSEKDYEAVILDLHGQLHEQEDTIKGLREELRTMKLFRRPSPVDDIEPVLLFAWRFVLLFQAATKSRPLTIGSDDFVSDHLDFHSFTDTSVPERVAKVQVQRESGGESRYDPRNDFAKLKGLSSTLSSTRSGLHKPLSTTHDSRRADDKIGSPQVNSAMAVASGLPKVRSSKLSS